VILSAGRYATVCVGGFAAVVLLWWGGILVLGLDRFTARTPADVWRYLATSAGAGAHERALLAALSTTVGNAALGYLAGTLAACLLAGGLVMSRMVEHAVTPVALVLRAVPLAAMTPVITLAVGQGLLSVTVIASVVVFFPTLVNVSLGLRSASRPSFDLLAAYGASSWQTFWKVRVPGALEAFLASSRIAVPSAIIGVLIAEWLVTGNGIGAFMINAQNTLDYDALWSAALFITLVAALLYGVLSVFEGAVLARRSVRVR
jgi:ABC-type nitrate/sulfonate/bicarbonate transport system permease component